jgi:hypothetical protein
MTDLNAIREALTGKAPGAKGGGNDIKWYAVPKSTDEVRIRILPPMEGQDFPFKMVIRHYNVPDMDGNPVCPSTFNIQCPICETLKEYEGRLDLNDWAAQVQCYANVLVRKDPTQAGIHAKEVYVFRSSRGMLKWFSDAWADPEYQTICDAYDGRDIIVNRKKYNGALEIKPAFSSSTIGDTNEEIESILSKMVNLDKIWGPPNDNDYAEIQKGADTLREVIENKILQIAGDEQVETADPDVPNEEMPVEEEVQAAEEATEEVAVEEEQAPEPVKAAPVRPAPKPAPTRPAASAPARPAPTAKPVPTAAKPPVRPAATKPAPTRPAAAPAARPAPVAAKPAAGKPPVGKPQAGAVTKPAPAKATTTVSPSKTKVKVSKPSDAPECFGDSGTYNEAADVCLECPHEFSCREIVTGSGA